MTTYLTQKDAEELLMREGLLPSVTQRRIEAMVTNGRAYEPACIAVTLQKRRTQKRRLQDCLCGMEQKGDDRFGIYNVDAKLRFLSLLSQ